MPIPTIAANDQKPSGVPVNAKDIERVKLFQPYQKKSVTTHNRLGVSPMCMYSADDGYVNDFHLGHYLSFALKGPGLVMVEASGVTPEGRITPRCLGIWDDSHIEGMKKLSDNIKSQGSKSAIQIAHAGRKASTSPPYMGDYVIDEADGGWPNRVVGPSDNAYASHYATPHALTKEEIKQHVQAFADAAVRVDKAGFDILEIHGAHGYLISSFYSASSNKRTDEYGGSFENRIRFALEVAQAVRDVWPQDKPLWMRLSCSDYSNPDPMGHSPDGWDIYQTIELAKELKKIGVDVIDCSSGGIIPGVKYPSNPLYQVPFAEAVKKEAGIDTATVGLIVEGEDAENVLQKGQADFVLAGREFLRDSAFVLRAAQSLDVEIVWPKQYSWAVKKARRQNAIQASKTLDEQEKKSIP
ncbi:hypothetical protein BD560DRAFT_356120 [Blakeslea trispora]|nr:hypothetical protein BD560DRAFT_356120 [Blakeslea trispora]